MEDAENSITGVDTMFIGVVTKDYISTGVTKDMKLGAMGHLIRIYFQHATMTIRKAL
jgi:hypothetical protein